MSPGQHVEFALRDHQGTHWYFVGTMVLIVGLVAWFSLQPTRHGSPQTVAAADAAPAEPAPESSGPSVAEVVGLTALLIVPVVGIVVIARLQQRRKAAYRDAARMQKQEARAAEINANRRDQNMS